jgi:hypothetical protein
MDRVSRGATRPIPNGFWQVLTPPRINSQSFSADTKPSLRGSRGTLQVPRLPPDFLSGLVESVNLVRLSLEQRSRKSEFARDDKLEGGGLP